MKRELKRKQRKRIRSIICLLAAVVTVLGSIPGNEALSRVSAAPEEGETSEIVEADPGDSLLTEPAEVASAEEAEEESSDTNVYENSISGVIWVDEDNDGEMDGDETKVANYPLYLYQADDTSGPLQMITTNIDGEYVFEDMEPGEYIVGLKSETINVYEYLLPLQGYSGDNQFKMADDYVYAYTKVLTVEEDSVITEQSGGVRTMTIAPIANTTYSINIASSSLASDISGMPGVSFASNILTIDASVVDPTDAYEIRGATTTRRLVVATGTNMVNIRLNGASISHATLSPFRIQGTAEVMLTLADGSNNVMRCTQASGGSNGTITSGIYVSEAAALTILGENAGTGRLTAEAGYACSAGIGGGYGNTTAISCAGRITINGGVITAKGGNEAAGIGGGSASNNRSANTKEITINAGTVTTTGAMQGAGIGGGKYGIVDTITINGGNVTANVRGNILQGLTIGGQAAGIGSSYFGGNGTIIINGGTIDAKGGFHAGAGIGSGTVNNSSAGRGTVMITGGVVTAASTSTSTLISDNSSGGTGIGACAGDAVDVTITGGTINARGGRYSSGIGGGNSSPGGDVTITGGRVTARAGVQNTNGGAIGKGQSGTAGTTVFTGGSILVYNSAGGQGTVNPAPTNGVNGAPDPVGLVTFPGYADGDPFSIIAGGTVSNYTYDAIAHADGNVYAWLAYPGVTTDSATASSTPATVSAATMTTTPGSSTATLNGSYYLNNTYTVTSAYFEWGTTTAYTGGSQSITPVTTTATSIESASVNITSGLVPGETYHYRFVIVTNGITIHGNDQTFTTPALSPSVDAIHDVTSNTTATLSGIYDLNGGTFISGEFELSTTGTSGPWMTLTNTSTPAVSSGTGVTANTAALDNSSTMPEVHLSNLTQNTTYYYRFTVTNSEGTRVVTGSWTQRSTTSLAIDKTVSGTYGDPDKAFEITITLENSGVPVSGTYAYTGSAISGVTAPANGNITFNAAGQGILHLKHGQTITITGLTQSHTYTVQETDAAVSGGLYTAAYSGTGTVSGSGSGAVISETLGSAAAAVSISNDRSTIPATGIGRMDHRLAAVGFLIVLTAVVAGIWSYRRRKLCR